MSYNVSLEKTLNDNSSDNLKLARCDEYYHYREKDLADDAIRTRLIRTRHVVATYDPFIPQANNVSHHKINTEMVISTLKAREKKINRNKTSPPTVALREIGCKDIKISYSW
jgi:hypothetical protein